MAAARARRRGCRRDRSPCRTRWSPRRGPSERSAKRVATRDRSSAAMPAWYAAAFQPRPRSVSAHCSVWRRVAAYTMAPPRGAAASPSAAASASNTAPRASLTPSTFRAERWRLGRAKPRRTSVHSSPRRSCSRISRRTPGRRRGGAREDPGWPQSLEQRADAPVVGPKVVPPLRDAVRLVDRDELHVAARERLDERVGGEALGGRVHELVPPAEHRRLAAPALVGVERRGQERRRHAACFQRANLVLHERDERRQNEGRSREHGGGHLVSERLAAAGRARPRAPGPLPVEQGVDGFALPRAESFEPKRIAEDFGERVRRHSVRRGPRGSCVNAKLARIYGVAAWEPWGIDSARPASPRGWRSALPSACGGAASTPLDKPPIVPSAPGDDAPSAGPHGGQRQLELRRRQGRDDRRRLERGRRHELRRGGRTERRRRGRRRRSMRARRTRASAASARWETDAAWCRGRSPTGSAIACCADRVASERGHRRPQPFARGLPRNLRRDRRGRRVRWPTTRRAKTGGRARRGARLKTKPFADDSNRLREELQRELRKTVAPSLAVILGPDVGARVVLHGSVETGRDPACELPLHDENVSWRHARVEDRGCDEWAIVDLESTNGTILNGQPCARAILKPGDRIFIGKTVIEVQKDAVRDAQAAELERLLSIDDLSGLWVRRRFDAQLESSVAAVLVGTVPTLSVVVMDMDGVKAINDTHGHAFGAFAIGETGRVLGRVIGSRGFATRFGGDEFAAAFPGARQGRRGGSRRRDARSRSRRTSTSTEAFVCIRALAAASPRFRATARTPRPSSRPPTRPCTGPSEPEKTASRPDSLRTSCRCFRRRGSGRR